MKLERGRSTRLFAAAGLLGVFAAAAVLAETSPRCGSAEHRRFDFWSGDWDAYDVGGANKPIARAHVDIILEGCALREIYEQEDGVVGQSFTAYDASRQLWHQTWVTNRGTLLQIDGAFRDDAITMQGTRRTAQGGKEIIRGVWRPEGAGVRETADTSIDGGATWKPLFDIRFQRHSEGAATREASAAGASAGDARIVATLDTQYQAAVAKNDAAGMDRILADDFLLVTGRGKTFTKTDLLQEARSADSVYEKQEDSSQTVRVWGNTAVVTALLWAKGTRQGKPFDYKLWFSDTYVRTPDGWRYVFGQASIPLPPSN
ncbi:MAG TPA: nuclear transport factor 2 family protein [Thermoanaerobaculia bacterium]